MRILKSLHKEESEQSIKEAKRMSNWIRATPILLEKQFRKIQRLFVSIYYE